MGMKNNRKMYNRRPRPPNIPEDFLHCSKCKTWKHEKEFRKSKVNKANRYRSYICLECEKLKSKLYSSGRNYVW